MSRYQKSTLQIISIWVGFALIGLPLVLLFAASSLPLFVLAMGSWIVFCGCMLAVARWLGWRIVLIETALLLAGVPLAFLFAMLISNLTIDMAQHSGFILLAFGWFLGFWSLLSGLLTRNGRGMYVAIHLSNWLFCLGIIAALGNGASFPYLLLFIPLGIMFLLLGLSKPILQKLALLPFLQKNRQTNTVPKQAAHQDYEQGYRPAYQEGENIYTYPDEQKAPTAYSFPVEMQQQQQQ